MRLLKEQAQLECGSKTSRRGRVKGATEGLATAPSTYGGSFAVQDATPTAATALARCNAGGKVRCDGIVGSAGQAPRGAKHGERRVLLRACSWAKLWAWASLAGR